jgi:hypothetical protein
VDSSLPESGTFTLVDTLHGITLFFILVIMIANAYVLKLDKQEQAAKARKFDIGFGSLLMVVYIILNVFFIWRASK